MNLENDSSKLPLDRDDDNYEPPSQEEIDKIFEDTGLEVLGIDPEELTPEMRKVRTPFVREWVKGIFKGTDFFKDMFGGERDQPKDQN